MKKYITILILLCTLSAQAQSVGDLSFGSDTLVFASKANTIQGSTGVLSENWNCDTCLIYIGEPLRITGEYIMNAPITRYCEGRASITAETRTFRPNEYRDFVPQFTTDIPNKNAYKITRKKILGWSLVAIGGASDGLLEGYLHDGRTSFERKWNADKTGFWGSESWRSIYKDGEPANGFKTPLHGWFGARDFYHLSDDSRKVGYITGGVMIGIETKVNTKWWHYAVDFGISFAASALSKSAAYYYIRN